MASTHDVSYTDIAFPPMSSFESMGTNPTLVFCFYLSSSRSCFLTLAIGPVGSMLLLLLLGLLQGVPIARRGVILAMAESRASMLSNSSISGPEMVATRIWGFNFDF